MIVITASDAIYPRAEINYAVAGRAALGNWIKCLSGNDCSWLLPPQPPATQPLAPHRPTPLGVQFAPQLTPTKATIWKATPTETGGEAPTTSHQHQARPEKSNFLEVSVKIAGAS